VKPLHLAGELSWLQRLRQRIFVHGLVEAGGYEAY